LSGEGTTSGEWLTYLTRDEVEAWRETDHWLGAEASRFKKMLGLTRKPIEYAYGKVPESLRESIASAILGVLNQVRDGSANLVSAQSVKDKIGRIPEGELGMFRVGIRTLDTVALSLIGQSKNLCTAEGAATGVAGLPGIVVDIPALYGLLFRMIAQVSVCYGYTTEPEEERTHLLKILEIGHHSEAEARRQGMDALGLMQQMIRDDVPVVEVQRFAVEKGLQTMARHLGLALTQRKLAQSVVLMGGVVGAGVNRQLAGEVGEVSFHAYRRRHLVELAYLRKLGALAGARVSAPGQVYVRAGNANFDESELAAPQDSPIPEAVGAAEATFAEGPTAAVDEAVADMVGLSNVAETIVAMTSRASEAALAQVYPTGGAFKVMLDHTVVNRFLQRFPDYQLEYRYGCFLGRVKLPISAVRVVVIPSCNSSHAIFTLPFKEIKSEGAGGFLLSKIVSTFWGTIAKQIEGNVVPKLQRLGFSGDTVTLERGKGSGGEFGQIKLSLLSLNRWLATRPSPLQASFSHLEFRPEGIQLQGRLDQA
jgi:hypothetical protein